MADLGVFNRVHDLGGHHLEELALFVGEGGDVAGIDGEDADDLGGGFRRGMAQAGSIFRVPRARGAPGGGENPRVNRDGQEGMDPLLPRVIINPLQGVGQLVQLDGGMVLVNPADHPLAGAEGFLEIKVIAVGDAVLEPEPIAVGLPEINQDREGMDGSLQDFQDPVDPVTQVEGLGDFPLFPGFLGDLLELKGAVLPAVGGVPRPRFAQGTGVAVDIGQAGLGLVPPLAFGFEGAPENQDEDEREESVGAQGFRLAPEFELDQLVGGFQGEREEHNQEGVKDRKIEGEHGEDEVLEGVKQGPDLPGGLERDLEGEDEEKAEFEVVPEGRFFHLEVGKQFFPGQGDQDDDQDDGGGGKIPEPGKVIKDDEEGEKRNRGRIEKALDFLLPEASLGHYCSRKRKRTSFSLSIPRSWRASRSM